MNTRRIGWWLAQIPSLVVVAQIASFYAFVTRARLAFGEWPSHHHSDHVYPSVHGTFIVFGGLATALTPALAMVFLAVARTLGVAERTLWNSLATYVAVFALWFILFAVDPGHFGKWFLD